MSFLVTAAASNALDRGKVKILDVRWRLDQPDGILRDPVAVGAGPGVSY